MVNYRSSIQTQKRRLKKGECVSLYQRLYYQGKQWQVSLGITVPLSNYDFDTDLVTGHKDADRMNAVIRISQDTIRGIFLHYELVARTVPSLEDVTGEYMNRMREAGMLKKERVKDAEDPDDVATKPKDRTLSECIDEFITSQKETRGWTDGTGKRFSALQKHFDAYNDNLRFGDLSDDVLMDFMTSLADDGMQNTTLQRYAGLVRWYLRWAHTKGYYEGNCAETFRPKFKGGDFSEKNIIYLTAEELRKLEDFRFSKNDSHLEHVRDVFLFSCYSGLRYSDIAALKPQNISNDMINVVTKKDRSRLNIDLNKHTRAIIERYREYAKLTGKLLPVVSNQKTNKYLHDLCERVGINELTPQHYDRGRKSEDVWLPKYELITFHCGRKTFITQGLRLGLPVPVIMKFSGHKNPKMLKRYMEVVDDLKKKEMAKFDDL